MLKMTVRSAPLLVLATVLLLCRVAATPPERTTSMAAQSPPPASPSPSVSSSALSLRHAVERLAGPLSFQPFVPEALPSGLTATARLERPLASTQTDPLLVIELTPITGGEPVVTLSQGNAACCLDAARPGVHLDTLIRTRPERMPGDPHTEVRGEMIAPRSQSDGLTLWWHEEAWYGGRTYLQLTTPLATTFDAAALVRIARTVQPVDRPVTGGAVLLYWSTHQSHSPTGHRVSVGTRNDPVPDEVRLLDGQGDLIGTAGFEMPKPYEWLRGAAAVAAIPVPREVVQRWRPGGAEGFRLEARFGAVWRPVDLVASSCMSIE